MYSSPVVSRIDALSRLIISSPPPLPLTLGDGGESDWITHLSFLRPSILFAPTIARHLDNAGGPSSSSSWFFVFWSSAFLPLLSQIAVGYGARTGR